MCQVNLMLDGYVAESHNYSFRLMYLYLKCVFIIWIDVNYLLSDIGVAPTALKQLAGTTFTHLTLGH